MTKFTVRFAASFAVPAFLAMQMHVASGADDPRAQAKKAIEAFRAAAQSEKSLPAERVEKALEAVKSLADDPDASEAAITEGLRELYPDYRDALSALGDENLSAAEAALAKLADAPSPFLAADASYFLARVHLVNERYEEALPLLERLEKKYAGSTLRTGEAIFLMGVSQSQLLQRKSAIASLQRFIDGYPDAPERMKIGAERQLVQLKLVEEGTLSDVQTRMDFSRRRLSLEDTGNDVQTEQKKITAMLEKLIKDAEERECNCKGGGKPGEKKQNKAGEGEQSKEGSEQKGQTGGGSKGIDDSTAEKLHRGGPQSPWSKLREKERDPVFNAIKEKFPQRYEQLIEQYYKSFQDESEG